MIIKNNKNIEGLKARWFLKNNGEFYTLKLKINKPIKEILKTFIVNNTTENFILNLSRYNTINEEGENVFKRFKIKCMVFENIGRQNIEILFSKTLLNSGILEINFKNLSMLNNFKEDLEFNLIELLKFNISYSEIKLNEEVNISNLNFKGDNA